MAGTSNSSDTLGGLGLHLKLVLAGSITTLIGIALVSVFFIHHQAGVLHAEIDRSTEALRVSLIERGRLLAESLSASMENAIAGYDFEFVNGAIGSLQKKTSNLAVAYIANADNAVIVHSDPQRVGELVVPPPVGSQTRFTTLADGTEVVEIHHPITVGGAPWGTLVLAFDLRTIATRAAEGALRGEQILIRSTTLAIVAGVLVALCGVIASVVLSRRMLRPIVALADDAAAIAQGNLDREIRATDSRDEIGFLACQFEQMRRSVKSYVGELVVAKQKAEDATREEKRLRNQIQEHSKLLEIKVEERTVELREINQRLTEYDRMKSEFLSNVSHELRSPLAAISSAAKIIGRYGDENKRTGKKFSTVIMGEADRLGRLINDLLDLAKIEAGRVDWNMERIENPFELVEHVATTFKPLADERKIDLILESVGTVPPVEMDEDRMVQVLTNLCSNAMKFTPEGGRISLLGRAATHDGQPVFEIVVQDTGPGIPPQELEKVFDRFHQVKVKREGSKPKGTGLGLAICREVVNHHGGRIWAEAAPGGGARMVLVLPSVGADRLDAAAGNGLSAAV